MIDSILTSALFGLATAFALPVIVIVLFVLGRVVGRRDRRP